MAFSLKIIVLSLILAAKYSSATPIPESKFDFKELDTEEKFVQHIKNKFNRDELTPKEILAVFFIREYKKFFNFFYTESVSLSEAILADPEILNNDLPAVKEFAKNLTDYLDKTKNINGIEDELNLLILFGNYTDMYETKELEEPTKLDYLIEGYLNKHGMDKFIEESKQRLDKAIVEFFVEFDKFKATLDEKDLEKYKKFIEFVNELKTKDSIESRLECYSNFFTTDDDDDGEDKN
ncbi:uncharacterized protein ACN2A1_006412 [Glossina fuscipes fuscipes]